MNLSSFEIPGALTLETTPAGLVRALISTPVAAAEIYLQGAHVAQWTPRGQKPVLFLSSTSQFAPGKAIRGGIPVIFPWFGARSGGRPGPAHGFARTATWTLESTRLSGDGGVEVTMSLGPDEATSALGFGAFHARCRVVVGTALHVELEFRNDAAEPVLYEDALHTYLAVSGIQDASVTGLEGTTYLDKTDGFSRKVQPDEPVICTRETDQVHLDTAATCVVHDAGWDRRIVVEKTGSRSTIVWTPWSGKAAAMADMGPGEWERMLCVESGNAADNAFTLAPGETHTLTATIRVE